MVNAKLTALLGHEGVLTTFLSYGVVADSRQCEIMQSLATPKQEVQMDINEIAALLREMRDNGVKIIAA